MTVLFSVGKREGKKMNEDEYKVLTIRFLKCERDALREEASTLGISMAALVRFCLHRELPEVRTTILERRY